MSIPQCDQCGRFTTNSEDYDEYQPTPWNGPNMHRWCDRCQQKSS